MEVYRSETAEIIRRFVNGQISHAECIATLDAALSGIVSRLKPEELAQIRAIYVREQRDNGEGSKTAANCA